MLWIKGCYVEKEISSATANAETHVANPGEGLNSVIFGFPLMSFLLSFLLSREQISVGVGLRQAGDVKSWGTFGTSAPKFPCNAKPLLIWMRLLSIGQNSWEYSLGLGGFNLCSDSYSQRPCSSKGTWEVKVRDKVYPWWCAHCLLKLSIRDKNRDKVGLLLILPT